MSNKYQRFDYKHENYLFYVNKNFNIRIKCNCKIKFMIKFAIK